MRRRRQSLTAAQRFLLDAYLVAASLVDGRQVSLDFYALLWTVKKSPGDVAEVAVQFLRDGMAPAEALNAANIVVRGEALLLTS